MRFPQLAGDWARKRPRQPKKLESIALVSSGSFNLVHFRGPLISSLVADGVRVFVFAPGFADEEAAKIRAFGGEPITMRFNPAAASPLVALLEAIRLSRQLRELKPDAVLAFFIKASVVATLAAVLASVKNRFMSIEGLGYFLGSSRKFSIRDRVIAFSIKFALRICIMVNRGTYFLNTDNIRTIMKGKTGKNIIQIKGVGVDLGHYRRQQIPAFQISFVYVGRLLFEKGIVDYVLAAEAVRVSYPEVTFLVVGTGDGTARSVPHEAIRRWQSEGKIIWLGQLADVRPAIARATALVLPSSYGEGAPRCIQEAMAMGRPVITTDVPGCREMIQHNVNGLLISASNVDALAGAITTFVEKPELAVEFGKAGRHWAEEHFNAETIAESMKNNLIQRLE
jgi:glycosyltransferase involved in cell wall biosynthesis